MWIRPKERRTIETADTLVRFNHTFTSCQIYRLRLRPQRSKAFLLFYSGIFKNQAFVCFTLLTLQIIRTFSNSKLLFCLCWQRSETPFFKRTWLGNLVRDGFASLDRYSDFRHKHAIISCQVSCLACFGCCCAGLLTSAVDRYYLLLCEC